jgi:hypothetical protein
VTNPASRQSAPTLFAVGRAVLTTRETLVARWAQWIADHANGGTTVSAAQLERLLGLIVGLLAHMIGPLRREAREAWSEAAQLYGRIAEARGLSTGEVAEEFQHLRELLVVSLGDIIVAMPARQQMPAVLRVNRVCDLGVASAVVGYTDALVAKMFVRDGVPVPTADSVQELVALVAELDGDLRRLDERSAG